jgi:broad specificity phosphatase PhoE
MQNHRLAINSIYPLVNGELIEDNLNMQLVVIRHARTAFNEKELINGTIDEELSPAGLGQIDDLVESLAGQDFNVVYASPLKRSVQTATPIAQKRNVPLAIDARITEVDLGSFNGKSWDSTIPDFGLNSSGVLSSCEYDFRPYGGEAASETQARVQSFIDDLKNRPNERPLVVSHGGILRWFYFLCTGKKTGRIPNSSIHTFTL